MVLDNIVR